MSKIKDTGSALVVYLLIILTLVIINIIVSFEMIDLIYFLVVFISLLRLLFSMR